MSEKTVRPNLVHALVLLLLAFSLVLPCPEAWAALKRKGEASLDDTWNPKPEAQDVILPMPGNLSMVFRVVAVPANGFLWSLNLDLGVADTSDPSRSYYDSTHKGLTFEPAAAPLLLL